MDYQKIIDRYYAAGSSLRHIYITHCRAVADEALAIAHLQSLPITDQRIEAAAMLHDIGIFATSAPSIECHGDQPYIAHGLIGRGILLKEGVDAEIADVAALHTGSGLTAREIIAQSLPLPHEDLCPVTLLQKLICYADKFYSKSGSMQRNPLEKVRAQMAAFGAASLSRFEALHSLFTT